MFERVKLALRISHNLLDDEIKSTISAAISELKRLGVADSALPSLGTDGDPLVQQAIITYCLMKLSSNEKLLQGYADSFALQVDNIRKSVEYV